MPCVIEIGEPRASAREQRREDLRDRAERSRREVRDLHGRHGRRRVGERAGPAEIVEVVARPLLVAAADAEARDRAVDRVGASVVGTDAEPRGDTGAEAFEHDVGAREKSARELETLGGLEIADDGLLAGVERVVPRRRGRAQRVAFRRLDPHDPRAEPL